MYTEEGAKKGRARKGREEREEEKRKRFARLSFRPLFCSGSTAGAFGRRFLSFSLLLCTGDCRAASHCADNGLLRRALSLSFSLLFTPFILALVSLSSFFSPLFTHYCLCQLYLHPIPPESTPDFSSSRLCHSSLFPRFLSLSFSLSRFSPHPALFSDNSVSHRAAPLPSTFSHRRTATPQTGKSTERRERSLVFRTRVVPSPWRTR